MNAELARLFPSAHRTLVAGHRYWQGTASSTAALLDRNDQPKPLYAACILCSLMVRIDRIDLAHEHLLTCIGA